MLDIKGTAYEVTVSALQLICFFYHISLYNQP